MEGRVAGSWEKGDIYSILSALKIRLLSRMFDQSRAGAKDGREQ
jgi:hypothetical protein